MKRILLVFAVLLPAFSTFAQQPVAGEFTLHVDPQNIKDSPLRMVLQRNSLSYDIHLTDTLVFVGKDTTFNCQLQEPMD